MGGVDGTALIAVDWGTSSARAYRVDRVGRILEQRAAPLGVQHVRDGAFAPALAALLGEWVALPVTRIACGMIGSRQGWVEAPYFECPAAIDDLARSLTRTPQGELAIVPGLITRDEAGIPDVMRGEETQLAGAFGHRNDRMIAVLPGTHSKWAHVEAGRIVDFRTYLTGELYAVLLEHSILGRLADRSGPASADSDAFARGVSRGLAAGDVVHDMFGSRTLVLAGELAPHDVPDWLSGLLIGREVRAVRRWAFAESDDAPSIDVIGADALVARYGRALALAGIEARPAPADAAVAGLVHIARATGLMH